MVLTRARRRLRRRCRTHQGDQSRTTAPGTSRASSASSPRPTRDDLFENIFHLVLARPEGAGPGTKGLSLFFVPKTHFNFETEEFGERNGVFVTNVEHKMGLKVSRHV